VVDSQEELKERIEEVIRERALRSLKILLLYMLLRMLLL